MNLLQEKRSVTYAIVFGIWAQVFLYCVLHDQYLIRISPEHFTVYHPPLWGITDLTLLAVAWAFRASIGPGLVLGLAALFLGRTGQRPKVAPGRVLKVVPWLLLATEVAGLAAGAWVWKTKQPLFPEIVYPDLTEPMPVEGYSFNWLCSVQRCVGQVQSCALSCRQPACMHAHR
ncbi:MAG: hypothetical protein EOP83_19790 [Verrucomicrobiaceae bacterium]|nr:MAG: hypothetical protein EOP83_19790 [Verrucomicrobiaceae bacterium]